MFKNWFLTKFSNGIDFYKQKNRSSKVKICKRRRFVLSVNFKKTLILILVVLLIALIFLSGYLVGKNFTLKNTTSENQQSATNPSSTEQEEQPQEQQSYVQVEHMALLSISKDREWAIYMIDISNETYLYASKLTTENWGDCFEIAQGEFETCFDVQFIGDSHRIIYGPHGVNGPSYYLAIYDLDKKTNKYILEGDDNKDYAFFFDISKDNRYLAYVGGEESVFPDCATTLWLKDLQTGKEKILINYEQTLNRDTYISNVKFVGDNEIQYTLNAGSSKKYFIVDFNGKVRPLESKGS